MRSLVEGSTGRKAIILKCIKNRSEQTFRGKLKLLFNLIHCASNRGPLHRFLPSFLSNNADFFPPLPISLRAIATRGDDDRLSSVRDTKV